MSDVVQDFVRRGQAAQSAVDRVLGEKRCWLIVSWEHNAFWRPAERGYTKRVEEAGRYSLVDAAEICARANIVRPPDSPNVVMVVAPEFVK